jgi:hypothetical protein
LAATQWTWTLPTTYTDGTAIAPGDITSLVIGIRSTTSPSSVPGTYPLSITCPPTATSQPLLPDTASLKADTYQSAINVITGATSSGFTAETTTTAFAVAQLVPSKAVTFSVS